MIFFLIALGLSNSPYYFATTARTTTTATRTTTTTETTVTTAVTTTTMEKTKFCSKSMQQLLKNKVETFRRRIKKTQEYRNKK